MADEKQALKRITPQDTTSQTHPAIMAFYKAINFSKFLSEKEKLFPHTKGILEDLKTKLEAKKIKDIENCIKFNNQDPYGVLGHLLISEDTAEASQILQLAEKLYLKNPKKQDLFINLFFGPEKDRGHILFFSTLFAQKPTFTLWSHFIYKLFSQTSLYKKVYSYGRADFGLAFRCQFLLALMFDNDIEYENHMLDLFKSVDESQKQTLANALLAKADGFGPLEYLQASKQTGKIRLYLNQLRLLSNEGYIKKEVVVALQERANIQLTSSSSSTKSSTFTQDPVSEDTSASSHTCTRTVPITSIPENNNENQILFKYLKEEILSKPYIMITGEEPPSASSLIKIHTERFINQNPTLGNKVVSALSEALSSGDLEKIKPCLTLLYSFHGSKNHSFIPIASYDALLKQKISNQSFFLFLLSKDSSTQTALPIYLDLFKKILGKEALTTHIHTLLKIPMDKKDEKTQTKIKQGDAKNAVKAFQKMLSSEDGLTILASLGNLKIQECVLITDDELNIPLYFDQLNIAHHEQKLTHQEYNDLLLGNAQKMHALFTYAMQYAHPKTLETWFSCLLQSANKNPIIWENSRQLFLSSPLINGCKNTQGNIRCYLNALNNFYTKKILARDEYEKALNTIVLDETTPRADREALQLALETIKPAKTSETSETSEESESTVQTTTTSASIERKKEAKHSTSTTPAFSNPSGEFDSSENWVDVGASGKPKIKQKTTQGASSATMLKQMQKPAPEKTSANESKKSTLPKSHIKKPIPIIPSDFPTLKKPGTGNVHGNAEKPVTASQPSKPPSEKKADTLPTESSNPPSPAQKPLVDAKKEISWEILTLQTKVKQNHKRNSDFWEGHFDTLKDYSLSTFKACFNGNSLKGEITFLGYLLLHGAEGGVEAWFKCCEHSITEGWTTERSYRDTLTHPKTLECLAHNLNKEDKGVKLFYTKFEQVFGHSERAQLDEEIEKIRAARPKPSESPKLNKVKETFFQQDQAPLVTFMTDSASSVTPSTH